MTKLPTFFSDIMINTGWFLIRCGLLIGTNATWPETRRMMEDFFKWAHSNIKK